MLEGHPSLLPRPNCMRLRAWGKHQLGNNIPMPEELIACISLPPVTISAIPIYEYAKANEELAGELAETYNHVAENVFVKDAWTSSECLETMRIVRFAILTTEISKHIKLLLKK